MQGRFGITSRGAAAPASCRPGLFSVFSSPIFCFFARRGLSMGGPPINKTARAKARCLDLVQPEPAEAPGERPRTGERAPESMNKHFWIFLNRPYHSPNDGCPSQGSSLGALLSQVSGSPTHAPCSRLFTTYGSRSCKLAPGMCPAGSSPGPAAVPSRIIL